MISVHTAFLVDQPGPTEIKRKGLQPPGVVATSSHTYRHHPTLQLDNRQILCTPKLSFVIESGDDEISEEFDSLRQRLGYLSQIQMATPPHSLRRSIQVYLYPESPEPDTLKPPPSPCYWWWRVQDTVGQ